MNPTLTAAAATAHQRDMLVRAAAARRARLLESSIQAPNPRASRNRRAHHAVPGLHAVRAWLAAGQL